MIPDLTLNAHHESAHAVIYEHFGILVEHVALYFCGAGCCHVSSTIPPSYGKLLAILAGPEADKKLIENDADALSKRRIGWEKDIEDAENVFRQLDRSESMEDVICEAGKVVHDNWHVIHSLAERWAKDSEQSWAMGDPLYRMDGIDIRKLISIYRKKTNG